jgi:hypothetical protein
LVIARLIICLIVSRFGSKADVAAESCTITTCARGPLVRTADEKRLESAARDEVRKRNIAKVAAETQQIRSQERCSIAALQRRHELK